MKKERDKRKQVSLGGRLVLLSRLLMTLHLGRHLDKDEVVHHIDGNPLNDSINNLQVMLRSDHLRLHHLGKKYRPRDLPLKPRMRINLFSAKHRVDMLIDGLNNIQPKIVHKTKAKARFKFIDPIEDWHPTKFEIGRAIMYS